ncbi:unnamed protein product [Lymnaea stagnalis]|uniref:non-specific protein-tyrosine kinase n=1 Tax=Lymnaea stagnalis TaxID=6523 RepID=A0AAV2HQQ6_LYMST
MKRLSRTSFRLSSKDPGKEKATDSVGLPPAMRDLQEFLAEAELSEYYTPLLTRLKVSTVEHLKYVKEEDLEDIGMSRPEMRRLKKFYKKEYPQGAINKLRKAILRGGGDGTGRTLSPSPPQQRAPRPASVGAPYIRPPSKQLIPVDSILLNKILGEGEFGVVQQGVWTTETGEKLQVAVKKLSRDRVNTARENLLKEAAVMQEVDHDHIVRMFGLVLDTEDNLMMVTELAPLRSLLECLKDPLLRLDLPIPRLCDFSQQICDGMSYLETKRLVHRDLAARNILVFSKSQVKISDLGLSRILGAGQDYYQSKFSVNLKLPIAWCAPESINFLKFTSASDMWSFGVLLWEMFTYGFQPWAGLNGQQILEAIDEPNCQYLEQPDLCTNEMYNLMKECWQHDPDARPSFASLLLRLPQLRPTQVKALKDTTNPAQGYMSLKSGDIIVVIDKSPPNTFPPGLVWRGVLSNGKSGLFDPTNAVPFIEPKISPVAAKTISLARKESSRKSGRKIRADMISRPQNDLRHTGHIGYDGAVFGDVSFIGDAYDKLPVRVDGGIGASRGSSVASIPHVQDSPDRNGHVRSSNSDEFLDEGRNGYGQSWMSRESLNSQSTMQSIDGRSSPSYYRDVEDDSLFSDFKMPDLGTSFDFGPSFMDEVLKALDEKEKQVSSSNDTTPTANQGRTLEADLRQVTSSGPPVPAPRDSRASSSSSTSSSISVSGIISEKCRDILLAPQEVPKEKKQAKVKPMSASEERMVDNVMARARELTAHRLNDSQSPPVSPSQGDRSFFEEESHGIISRLKNSIKRSSPKAEHKRTFSDDLENKGDINDEVSPEAQQAYNMLVVKGSFKENMSSSSEADSHDYTRDLSRSRTSSKTSQDLEPSWHEPDLIKDSKCGLSPPKSVSSPPNHPASESNVPYTPPVPSSRPTISPPQLQSKPVGVTQPKPSPSPAPVPAPRPVKQESIKKSEIPVPKPRPEIQRVEPTVRQSVPASPDIPPKLERRIDSHIPVPASRDSKDREREELKKTIEIVRVEDSAGMRDELSDKASTSFDRSSARSSQRSSLDRSDNNSENAESDHRADWDHSECSSDSSKPGRDFEPRTTAAAVERKDSFNKKQISTSLFEEDLSEPSPQEIMSKLRERRLNRHLDHQKALAGEGDGPPVVATTRTRPSAREPQGIPGRAPSVDLDESASGEGAPDEVDTNPLRMLRGGAIPIRTAGRGTAGTSNLSMRGALSLRVPQLNFSSHLSRNVAAHQKPTSEQEDTGGGQLLMTDPVDNRTSPQSAAAVAELKLEVDKLTTPPTSPSTTAAALSTLSSMTDAVQQSTNPSSLHSATQLALPTQLAPLPTQLTPLPTQLAPLKIQSVSTMTHLSDLESPPPRPPPRKCQSFSETHEVSSSRCLRRSSSFDSDSNEAPALPPRDPQPGRIPLNSRPRERKYPLIIGPNSPEYRVERKSLTARPEVNHGNGRKTTENIPHSSALSTTQRSNHQVIHSPRHNPQTCSKPIPMPKVGHQERRNQFSSNTPISRSLDSTSDFFYLPPAYDMSDCSSDIADSEPTHMLLDPHTSCLSPPLHPPSVDEPTHIAWPLSSNKHTWSSTFTRPSPLTHGGGHPKNFQRSLSYGPAHSYHLSDDTSPPADLPPAPPTPSYREKLGLDLQKPRVVRSISHNPSPAHHSSVDSHPTTYRGRSASDTSPNHTHPLSPHHVIRSMHHADDNDDDAFFDEAPSYPQPYSQTPFHPIVTKSSQVSSHGAPKFLHTSSQASAPPPLSPRTQPHPKSSLHQSKHSNTLTVKLTPHVSKTTVQSPVPPLVLPDGSRSGTDNPSLPVHALRTQPQKNHPRTGTAVFFKFPCLTSSSSSTSPPHTQLTPGHISSPTDASPVDYSSSSSDVSPLMFTSYTNASSASYEDLRQFALDRQKNCQEIETLLTLFHNQITVEECMTALETTHWDVNKASKYLQLKKLLSLGVADVHRCKEALATCGWDLQRAADSLLESSRTSTLRTSSRPGLVTAAPDTSPEIDVRR